MPGAIAPPTYSPRALTTSKVVAVPKSTTIAGPPYSVGGGERVDDPVGADLARVVHQHRDAGPHARLDDDRAARRRSSRASMSRHSCSTAGTVEQTAMPRSGRRPGESCSSPRSSTAHSSAVRRSSVATRQWSTHVAVVEQAEDGVAVADVGGEQRPDRRSRPQVQADVEDRRGVGERADRDEVDAGRGDLAGPLEGEPAGGLEPRPGPR